MKIFILFMHLGIANPTIHGVYATKELCEQKAEFARKFTQRTLTCNEYVVEK